MPHLAKEGESKTGKLAIAFEPDPALPRVKGVIEVRDKGGKQPAFYSVDLQVPPIPSK
jgi:hypothetical protein